MFEGTGKYFLLILLILFIVYITVKICLYFLFKKAKTEPYKALIPIYTTKVLVDLLNMKQSIFYLCLIPFVNLFYYYKIYQELLQGFGQEQKEAIWYILIPMYKFPELVFKKPKFLLNEYDLTSTFIKSQKALFEPSQEKLPDKIADLAEQVNEIHEQKDNISASTDLPDVIIEPVKYEQMPKNDSNVWNNNEKASINGFQNNTNSNTFNDGNGNSQISQTSFSQKLQEIDSNYQNVQDSVFTNKNLEPDKRQEKEYIVQNQEKQETKPINPVESGRPQMCPNCGAKLASGATTCFLCGTKLK